MSMTQISNDEFGTVGVQGVGTKGSLILAEARQRHGIAMSDVPTHRPSGDEQPR